MSRAARPAFTLTPQMHCPIGALPDTKAPHASARHWRHPARNCRWRVLDGYRKSRSDVCQPRPVRVLPLPGNLVADGGLVQARAGNGRGYGSRQPGGVRSAHQCLGLFLEARHCARGTAAIARGGGAEKLRRATDTAPIRHRIATLERAPAKLNQKRALASITDRIFCRKPVPTCPEML